VRRAAASTAAQVSRSIAIKTKIKPNQTRTTEPASEIDASQDRWVMLAIATEPMEVKQTLRPVAQDRMYVGKTPLSGGEFLMKTRKVCS